MPASLQHENTLITVFNSTRVPSSASILDVVSVILGCPSSAFVFNSWLAFQQTTLKILVHGNFLLPLLCDYFAVFCNRFTTRPMGFTRLLTRTAPTPISVTARKKSADFPTMLAEVFTTHCFARSQDRPEPAAANEHSKKTCKLDHCDVGDCLLGRR